MSKAAPKPQGTRQNVCVICRIRPTNAREIREGGTTCVKHDDHSIEVGTDNGPHTFNFDAVFGADSTQQQVFQESAGLLINDVLNGYNATIFAYGQTGTGKTHTMEGVITSDEKKGIIPRAVESLFDGVSQADENLEFTFKVSYVEIYLEKIRDLLDEHHTKVNLAIREDKIKGIYIAGVTEEYVTSTDELLDVMHAGAQNRKVAATGMNEGSSRSHSVFTITVNQKDTQTKGEKSGKLVLVDLAGSEVVKKTNATGQQLEEAKMINKSLSALGQVINALTDDKASHVPYRDSKLTRVLQDSLGGNSKTVLIVAVSPSSFNANETVSTLRFGMRAKSIENKVTVNATRSVEELEALLVRAENAIDAQSTFILTLTARLEAMQAQINSGTGIATITEHGEGGNQSGNNEATATSTGNNMVAIEDGKVLVEIAQLEAEAAAIQKLQEEVMRLSVELEDERADSQRKDGEISSLNRLINEKESQLAEISGLVTDLQASNGTLTTRSETLLQEKISAVGELASIKAMLDEHDAKMSYQFQEMEVTMNTLQTENNALRQEIAELSGDSAGASAATATSSTTMNIANGGLSPMKKMNNLINSDGIIGDESGNATPAVGNKAGSSASSTTTAGAVATAGAASVSAADAAGNNNNKRFSMGRSSDGVIVSLPEPTARALTNAERQLLLEEMSEKFASVCLQYEVDDNISADLFAVMDHYASEAERSFSSLEEKYMVNEKGQTKRIKDLDEQRNRLEKDLQNRTENIIQLQMKFESLGRLDNRSAEATLAERDRAKQKSLQQRLEQLVAVHRQLLRKFATLELENAELKKKTQLREERIKQLEDNSRTLVGNVRSQAEKHLAEVAIFREQIQIMKNEFDKQFEVARNAEDKASPQVMRQAAINRALQPKTIRGGGGPAMTRSFYQPTSIAGAGAGGGMMAVPIVGGNGAMMMVPTSQLHHDYDPNGVPIAHAHPVGSGAGALALHGYAGGSGTNTPQSGSFYGTMAGGTAAGTINPQALPKHQSFAFGGYPVPIYNQAPPPVMYQQVVPPMVPEVNEPPRSMGLAARFLGGSNNNNNNNNNNGQPK